MKDLFPLKIFLNKESVPGTGLEPAHLAAYAPQTYVSTNSTTRALKKELLKGCKNNGFLNTDRIKSVTKISH